MSVRFDRYTSLLFMVVGLAFIVESRRISESAYGSNVGPDMFPLGLGLILIVLSLRLFYETFRYQLKEKSKSMQDYRSFFILLGSAILYGLLLETVGYIITTFLFLVIGFQVMDRGGWWKTLLIAGCFSVGVYYLFVEVLNGTLPGFPIWFN